MTGRVVGGNSRALNLELSFESMQVENASFVVVCRPFVNMMEDQDHWPPCGFKP